MTEKLSYVGKRLRRPDVMAKVTGSAQYGADMKLPGMLIGRILMSPYAHAKVVTCDTSKAKALPGVEAVITHEDVPKLGFTRSAMAEGFPAVAQMTNNGYGGLVELHVAAGSGGFTAGERCPFAQS